MISKNHIYWLVYLLFITNLFQINAQKADIADLKKKYPGESRIILNQSNNIIINFVKDSLVVEMRKTEEGLCLDNNAILHAGESVTYSGFNPIYTLSAKTMLPVKSRFKPLPVVAFDTSDYREPGIFDNDVKKITFKYPKLEEGAKTFLEYSYKILESRFLTPFYFQDFQPVQASEVTVTFPSNVEVGYKFFNCDSLHIQFTQEQKRDRITYKWKALNVPKLQFEDGAPEVSYFAAHMFVFIKSYTLRNQKINVLSNTSDLFNWYLGFVDKLNKDEAPQLKTLVDSLVANTPNELDKVKKLFFWVQDHIKYIAFESGREGFEPRNASLVYTRRFGDCKDMASITTRMLELAGIKGYITWIGTRHIPYLYSELPLPATDNHMISTYRNNDKTYFLDATTGPHPFGYPSYMIQSKEALLKVGADRFEIVKVPEVEADKNLQADTLFIKLDGKKIVGRGVSYFRGYSRFEMYNLISQKDKNKQTIILKNYFQKGNNKFLIDNFTISNIDDRDKDLIISYNFNLADYAQILGNEIFINLNMEKVSIPDPIKNTRRIPIENNYKKIQLNHVVFEIPQGFKVTYLPENTAYTNDLFSFAIDYKNASNKVAVTHELTTNYLLLQPSHFEQLNEMNEKLKNAYKESVSLNKKE
jgi:hypothetical protein